MDIVVCVDQVFFPFGQEQSNLLFHFLVVGVTFPRRTRYIYEETRASARSASGRGLESWLYFEIPLAFCFVVALIIVPRLWLRLDMWESLFAAIS